MPMTNTDLADYIVDDSLELSDSTNSSTLNIIADPMTDDGSDLLTEKDDQETSKTASNTAELPDPETSVSPAPETGSTPSPGFPVSFFFFFLLVLLVG